MPENRLILVVHDEVSATAQPEALDTLVQMRAVREALAGAGHSVACVPFKSNLQQLRSSLIERPPALVFNLVEAPLGSDRLAFMLPAILEQLQIRYTGADFATMLRLADKTLAKQWLNSHGVDTPPCWTEGAGASDAGAFGPWIVKSIWEHASFGLSATSVVATLDEAQELAAANRERHGGEWFAERYVDGREFNVALLATADGPTVLPLAEIVFEGLPPDAPRIVDYAAKWLPESLEYQCTQRSFLDESVEHELAERLRHAALRTWHVCRLRGYARVDFRVDAGGRPWVVDVNANPCIAPDAGFAAAAAMAGMDYAALIAAIVDPLLPQRPLLKTG